MPNQEEDCAILKRLITVTEYAKRKGVFRMMVYRKIAKEVITPTLIGPNGEYQFIDWEKFKNVSFTSTKKP